jgi:two-component system chemotaxis response regulator CheB
MPRLDGVSFLREQMRRRPVPVLVVSITSESGEMMLRALEAGAFDMIQKPTALATEKVFEMRDELIAKVKAAAEARLTTLSAAPAEKVQSLPPTVRAAKVDIVVIGVSTGGPQALKLLIPQLPVDLQVPIVMVLHMPTGYTEMYARGLNDVSGLTVAEAKEGDLVRPGVALLAPAGHHLSFRRLADGSVVVHLDLRPIDLPHRPAVDVLFQSAAEVYGSRVLGVVMSGMGSDGTKGAAWIKAQGGTIFTEAEETCVVYGMPRSVVEAGLSDRSFPLPSLARAILEAL